MNSHKLKIVLLLSGIMLLPITINADDQEREQEQNKQQILEQEPKMMFGWELMTVKEREEHQEKMRSAKTEEERTAYRQEHHKKMQQRAKEQGVTIPDEPAERGSGTGQGGGQGTGGPE